MKAEKRTKEQLIHELAAMRQRVAELEQLDNEHKQAEEELRESEEEARRLAEENRVVAEIGRIISSTLKIEEVYEHFSEEARKIIPFDRITINLINTDQQTVTIAYVWGAEIEDRRQGGVYPLAGTTFGGMIHTKSSLLFQTEEEEKVKRRFPRLLSTFKAGFRSMISVPLIKKIRSKVHCT